MRIEISADSSIESIFSVFIPNAGTSGRTAIDWTRREQKLRIHFEAAISWSNVVWA